MKYRIVKHNGYYLAQVREWFRWRTIGGEGFTSVDLADVRVARYIDEISPPTLIKEWHEV